MGSTREATGLRLPFSCTVQALGLERRRRSILDRSSPTKKDSWPNKKPCLCHKLFGHVFCYDPATMQSLFVESSQDMPMCRPYENELYGTPDFWPKELASALVLVPMPNENLLRTFALPKRPQFCQRPFTTFPAMKTAILLFALASLVSASPQAEWQSLVQDEA